MSDWYAEDVPPSDEPPRSRLVCPELGQVIHYERALGAERMLREICDLPDDPLDLEDWGARDGFTFRYRLGEWYERRGHRKAAFDHYRRATRWAAARNDRRADLAARAIQRLKSGR